MNEYNLSKRNNTLSTKIFMAVLYMALNVSTWHDNYTKIYMKDKKEIYERLIIVIFSLNFCIFSVIPILFDSSSEAYAKVTNNPQNFNSLLHKMISCSSKVHCRSDIVDNKRWPLSYFPFLKHMLLSISSVGVWFPLLWTWTGLGDLPWPIEYGSSDGMGHPKYVLRSLLIPPGSLGTQALGMHLLRTRDPGNKKPKTYRHWGW